MVLIGFGRLLNIDLIEVNEELFSFTLLTNKSLGTLGILTVTRKGRREKNFDI